MGKYEKPQRNDVNSTERSDILVFNCYLCHVSFLLTCYVCSTKICEISDISKCFENFVSQALGVLTRIYAAELRINLNDDIGQLARIGYAEFRGGNSTEQLAGMDIVMNRVESDKFPNTIEGVIVQPWQFSSLNKNDNNRIFYTDPNKTLKIQSGKHKGELDKLNHNAWVKSLSNAIKVSNGSKRGISKSALLYYSPRSMTKDKKGNPTLPKWDFSKLKEIYVDGVRTSYIMMYNYKETKKKGQKQ